MTEQEALRDIRLSIVEMYEGWENKKPVFDKYFSLFIYIKTLKSYGLFIDYQLTDEELKILNRELQENPVINPFDRQNIRRGGIKQENELLKKHGGRAQDIKSLELTFKMIKENDVNLNEILGI